ncbi:MAG: HlyD family type I secretion periplasmic adaptor subunit [Pseudomonadales bacterium]|nr:HlyD family type I secretion periplasmic adaptor subunit [Pseudomonadales bacterium]
MASAEKDDAMNTTGPIVFGVAVLLAFVIGLGGWMVFAKLDSAAIASGVINVESKRKSIQHLEGGIIKTIAVRDGDEVNSGDILIELESLQARANLELIRGRYLTARAWEARLAAERDGLEEIEFSESLLIAGQDAPIAELVSAQQNIFKARSRSMQEQTAILNQRIAQYKAEEAGLNDLLKTQDEQLALIQDVIDSHLKLYGVGMIDKSRLRVLQRELAELKGERSQNLAAIARIGQNTAEVRLEIEGLQTRQLNEVLQQLRDVQSEIYDLTEQLSASRDVLARTEIRAPHAGTIVGLSVFTEGGVIAPGDTLMEIVPRDAKLVVEAQVDPIDIDIVEPGLEAQVHLTAFSQRTNRPIPAVVTAVSADRLIDSQTGAAYYLARLELDESEAIANGEIKLYPGMQAEVMVLAESRSPFEYFIEPLVSSFNRALREK